MFPQNLNSKSVTMVFVLYISDRIYESFLGAKFLGSIHLKSFKKLAHFFISLRCQKLNLPETKYAQFFTI